jgi:hypothetical protein
VIAASLLHVGWIIIVNGTVESHTLASTKGTALEPLAAAVGPSVDVVGGIFVFLALGFGSFFVAHTLAASAAEWSNEIWSPPSVEGDSATSARLSWAKLYQFGRAIAPVLLVFSIVEGLVLTERESFTRPLELLAVLAGPIIAGAVPLLLIRASRTNGDYVPVSTVKFVGTLATVVVLLLACFSFLLWYALGPWEESLVGSLTIFVAAVTAAIVGVVWWRGSFKPGAAVELVIDHRAGQRSELRVMIDGSPSAAVMTLRRAKGIEIVRAARCPLPRSQQLVNLSVMIDAVVERLSIRSFEMLDDQIAVGFPVRYCVTSGSKVVEGEVTRVQASRMLRIAGSVGIVELSIPNSVSTESIDDEKANRGMPERRISASHF